MRALIQRVVNSEVLVDGNIVGKINRGLLVLVGFKDGDTIKDIDYIVDKIVNLRIFDDENKIMNKSLIDIKGDILSVSQFTLYADTKKGRRPSYDKALNSVEAKNMYQLFNEKLLETKLNVQFGIFQSEMKISLINDGPVTIMLESR